MEELGDGGQDRSHQNNLLFLCQNKWFLKQGSAHSCVPVTLLSLLFAISHPFPPQPLWNIRISDVGIVSALRY